MIIGLDASLPMIHEARASGGQHFVGARLPDLPFISDSFDGVTMSFVVHFVTDPGPLLRDISRILRSGGRLGMTTWSRSASDNPAGEIWSRVAAEFVDLEKTTLALNEALPGNEEYEELDALAQVLESGGFRLLSSETRSFPVRIATDLWVKSRTLATGTRFMRSQLSEEEWDRFVRSVFTSVTETFGPQLEFETRVNFVVAEK